MATSRSIAMNPPMILPVMTAVMLLETERGVHVAISCDIAAESFSVLVVSGDSDIAVVVVVDDDDEDDVMLACVVVTV